MRKNIKVKEPKRTLFLKFQSIFNVLKNLVKLKPNQSNICVTWSYDILDQRVGRKFYLYMMNII